MMNTKTSDNYIARQCTCMQYPGWIYRYVQPDEYWEKVQADFWMAENAHIAHN